MYTNNYINSSNTNYFTSPFIEAASHLNDAFSSHHPLANRIVHLVTGISLMIPVVNIIIYAALKHFSPPPIQKPRPSLPRQIVPSAAKPQETKKPQTQDTKKPAPSFHGAGILPYRIVNGELEFLIGKEAHGIHKNSWSDFGGQPEKGESPIQTAARECAEETGNLFGSQSTLERTIKKANCIGSRYAMYLYEVNDRKITPKSFHRVHHDHEKSEIAWVKAKAVFEAARGNGMIAIGNSLERLRPPFIGTLKFRGTSIAPSAQDVFKRIQAEHRLRRTA